MKKTPDNLLKAIDSKLNALKQAIKFYIHGIEAEVGVRLR